MSEEKSSGTFFDTRTILAVGLTFLVWVGWQWHLQKKYPLNLEEAPTSSANTKAAEVAPAAGGFPSARGQDSETEKMDEVVSSSANAEVKKVIPEVLVPATYEQLSFEISSRGMGLKNVTLKSFNDRLGKVVQIGQEVDGRLPGETRLIAGDKPIHFDVQRVSDNQFIGRALVDGVQIAKKLEVNSSNYRIDTEVVVEGGSKQFLGITQYLVDQFPVDEQGGFFSPQLSRHEVFSFGGNGDSRDFVGDEQPISMAKDSVELATLGTPYFTQGFLNQSEILPSLKIQSLIATGKAEADLEKKVVAALQFSNLMNAEKLTIKFISYFGPRSLNLLEDVDPKLARSIDLGYFSSLGRPILKMLKWFYSLVGNWGIAIILLVLVVRFLVLPLHIMSYRSMKSMQTIQPMINSLKERYKDDKERLNREMMVLFKEHKVNPLGGCLPMLLQIPVFFALYQVLGHSVELYQAPFVLWIHDLSLKDPYYVLPVLMGATMFFQQKMTPSTLDPAQAKIMLMMPIVFSFAMLTLPSGLTLYFLISGVFGIVQQIFLTKNSPKAA